MKHIVFSIIFICFAAVGFGQSDEMLNIFVNKANLEYMKTNGPALQEVGKVVKKAHADADNNTIGQQKTEVITIIHTAPSIIKNIYANANMTWRNPASLGAKFNGDFDEYVSYMRGMDEYVELKISTSEVDELRKKVLKLGKIKDEMKSSNYAIHESQENSIDNVNKIEDFSRLINESYEILNKGINR